MPDPDLHTDTERDPRRPVYGDDAVEDEPAVGHARVDDDAVAEPDPGAAEAVNDGTPTTYESAAHEDGYHEWHEGAAGTAGDASFGRAKAFGTETDEAQRVDPDAVHADEVEADRDAAGYDETGRHAAEPTDADAEAGAEGDRVVAVPMTGTDAEDETRREEALADGSDVVDRTGDDTADTDATGLTYTGDEAAADREASDREASDREAADREAAEADEDARNREADEEAAVADDQEAVDDQADADETQTRPGEAQTVPVGRLWGDADVDGLRNRWRELQLKFIDDPQGVAGEAETLVTEAIDSVTAALRARKDELADWRGATSEDTERLRAAVRRYRDFLDQLLGL